MSAINPNNINGNYPVAGQDNDSQGFRDNFTNIRNNLNLAKTELEDLQNKVVLKTALNGTTLSNDMAGSQLVAPQLRGWTQALVDQGTVSGSIVVDYTYGNFQKITPSAPVIISFNNWPGLVGSGAIGYGNMRLWFDIQDVGYTVTLPVDVNIAVNDIAGYDPVTYTITFDSIGNYVFDISSADGGDTFMIFDVTRNRTTFRDSNFYYNTDNNGTLLVGWGPALEQAMTLEQGQDVISVKGSINAYQTEDIHQNNIVTNYSAGYAVTTSRANATTLIDAPVHAGDYIGYFDGQAFTGNATTYTTNEYKEMAGIKLFATGANVSLGGNIGIFTKADAGVMTQAVGIENDQSLKAFGNLQVGKQLSHSYQYYAPSANFGSQQIWSNVARVVMDPTTTITNGNLRLPSSANDGTIIRISSTQTITNLSVWAGGTTVTPSANVTLTGGTGIEYFYHATESKWYKVA